MSIYTSQPRHRRPLSGLGALAQLMPSIRARGWETTFRGLGDGAGPIMLTAAESRRITGASTSSQIRATIPTSVAQMDRSAQTVSSWTAGTLGEDGSGGSSAPFTIEGALPMGVAGVLGLALGLVAVSIFVGK